MDFMRENNRHSLRLAGYDYSQAGYYFVTICANNRKCLFGEVKDGKMVLNDAGNIVQKEWGNTEQIRNNVNLDEHIVMPNHIHGIIVICRGVLQYAPTNSFRSPSQTLGAIIRGFKSAVTKQINQSRNTPGKPVWQRNYHEHVIRGETDLRRIRDYIQNNPINWQNDEYNV